MIDEQFDEKMNDIDGLVASDQVNVEAARIKPGGQLLYISSVRKAVSSKDESPLVILALMGAEEDNKRIEHDHFLNFPKGDDNVSKFKRLKSAEFMEGLFGEKKASEGVRSLEDMAAEKKVFKARVSIDSRGGRTFVNIATEGIVGNSAPDRGPAPF